jgi:alanine-glyoxylate transaminase/serine-glyoxylate transaminase/serine-pyruvate transaminase
VRVEQPWGRAIDPQQLLDARRSAPHARLVAVVHAETSTGVESEIAPLAELQATDTLLVVDTVTSLGGIPVEVDAWGVDAVYSGTQKCLGVPPGLAPVSFSDRAVARVKGRATPPQSWYLDLGLIADYVGSARRYHHTAPISMIYALHAGLGVLLDEGLDATHARHRHAGALVRDALPELGFRPFAQDRPLPQLTSVWLPEGVDDAKLRGELRERFGIEVGGGLGDLAGKGWRIGLMGHSARERSVVALVGALRALL